MLGNTDLMIRYTLSRKKEQDIAILNKKLYEVFSPLSERRIKNYVKNMKGYLHHIFEKRCYDMLVYETFF